LLRSGVADGSSCVLAAAAPEPPAGAASVPASSTDHHRRARSGSVVVAIPRTVFIRVVGPWLLVTTNTGQPPQPADRYYTIANGHAALSIPSIRHQVALGCAK
jgi:hypothetical protein